MEDEENELAISLESAEVGNCSGGVEELWLHTNVGTISARYHTTQVSGPAVVWVGGAGGGLDGPAGGLYPRLAQRLTTDSIASLRLHYREPNDLENCVIDTLVGVQYLCHDRGHDRVALIGHSFGGAVVISAGALSEEVVAVAALSSQTYGTNLASQLSPRPLLLMHGTQDEILSDACSHQIYARALEPKEIRLYPGCRHGLDECRDQVDQDLVNWLLTQLNRHG